ncbi:MAG: hypothetical protein U0807_08880 [Candidatus Binatia bacterium]
MTGARGTSVVEALVAAGLVGLAAAVLVATAAAAGRAVALARETGLGIALSIDRAEALRAGPRADGSDTVTLASRSWTRRWRIAAGRGLPTRLTIEVEAPDGRRLPLATEVFP